MSTLWPSSQDEWDALAAKLRTARVEAIRAKLPPPPEDPPLSPEEEETLF